MRALARVELWGWDDPDTPGTVAFQRVLRALRCQTNHGFDGYVARVQVSLEVPRVDATGSRPIEPNDWIRLRYTDGDYDDFRLQDVDVSSGGLRGGVVLSGLSMIYELAESERLISETVSGRVSYSVTKRDQVGNLLSFVLGFGPSSFSVGDVTQTSLLLEVVFTQATPLAGAIAIAQAVHEATGIKYELSARRDGSSWKLDLTVLNSGAPAADLRTAKNLKTLTRTRSNRDQATRIIPIGPAGRSVGDNAWKVKTVTTDTSIEIEGINGGPGPIADSSVVGAVIDAGGTAHAVTSATVGATSTTLGMASTTGIAVGDWVRLAKNTSGDEVEYVGYAAEHRRVRTLSRPHPEHTNWMKNPTMLDWLDGAPGSWTKTIGGTSRTTANQGTAKGWTDPDGTSNGINTGTLDTGTTSFTIAAANRLYNIIGDPAAGSNVDAGDDNYTLSFKVTANRGDLLSGMGLERTVTATVTIEYSTDGGTNWTTLSGSYQVNSDITSTTTEFTPTVQVTGSPSQLRFRLILSAQINGGVASGSGSASVQVFANTWLTDTYAVTWTTGGAAPAEDTTAGRWLTGGRSAKFTSGQAFLTQSRSVYFPRTGWVTYSVWIYVEAKGSSSVSTIRFKNPQSGVDTTVALDVDSEIETGRWLQISRSFEITSTGTKTIEIRVGNSTSAGAGTWWCDAAQFSFDASEVALVVGSGGARLWQDGTRYIDFYRDPVYTYQVTIADLSRVDPVRWPYDELLHGATVNITDTELLAATSERIVALVRDELVPANTQVTFATSVPTLAGHLAEAA